jgi:phosphoribosylaminoimidazole-succinocarboxamide synthase
MNNTIHIDLLTLHEPDYVGSVQKLYFLKERPDLMVCQTTSGGSVFDVGTIFSIPDNDKCRAALRHKIYSLLETPLAWAEVSNVIAEKYKDNKALATFLLQSPLLDQFVKHGAPTHHVGMVDMETGQVVKGTFPANPGPYVVVKKYQVIRPAMISYQNQHFWDYSPYHGADRYVIPLEVIVRFGITPGSSIFRKYMKLNDGEKEKYLAELCIQNQMHPWQLLPVALVDFTTKYEPEDRNLSLQEALYICSTRSGEILLNLIRMAMLGAYLVSEFFRHVGLFLWDLKWEIAKDGDTLVFVDTIDTDSVRVTSKIDYKGQNFHVHFNKQAMRDYYRIMHSDWTSAVDIAKAEARKSGRPFHEHLTCGQAEGRYPATPVVDEHFVTIQRSKCNVLFAYILGHVSTSEAAKKIHLIGEEEINFYEKAQKLDAFSELNQV